MIRMTDIPLATIIPSRRRQRSRSTGMASRQTPINQAAFWCLLLLVALVPLPLASARPFFWVVAAVYVGLVGSVYTVLLLRIGENFRFTPPLGAVPLAAFSVFCLYLLIQTLPVADFDISLDAGLGIISPQLSIAPGMTMLMLMRQLTYGIFFFLILQVLANANRRVLLLDMLLMTIVAYGAYAMISLQSGDTILGAPKWAYPGSATGTFVNRNSFATFVAIGATIAAVRFASVLVQRSHHHADDGRPRGTVSQLFLFGFAFLFLALVLYATQSRLGLAAGTLGSALGFSMMLFKANGRLRYASLLALVLVVIGGLITLTAGVRLTRLLDLESDAVVRLDAYVQILELISRRPFLGWGGGSFEQAFQLVHRAPVTTDLVWTMGHNTYLSLWSELGVIVGSIPIIIVGGIAVLLIRKLFDQTLDPNLIVPRIAALAVIVLVGIHAMGDFSLEIPANTFLFLAVLGAGVATLSASVRKRP